MTSVGKLLVVLQLILSISFVVFAGTVYQTHQSWRAKAEASDKKAADATSKMNAAVNELNTKQAEAEQLVAAAEGRATQLEGELRNVEAERDAAERKNNQLEQELLAQTGIAETKAAEANFRLEQATEQSTVNNMLHVKLEKNADMARNLEDRLFAGGLAYEQLEGRYNDLLDRAADLETVLTASGVSTDVDSLRAQGEAPPPVDGLVLETRQDKTGRVRYVAISIGTDDGIVKGHELSVVRPAELNQGRAKYLGTIEIISLKNDSAVGRVVSRSKTGNIAEGDNVTSKL